MPDSAWQTKVSAVLGLMAVQITVGVLYRVAQAHGGGFHFSTMSAIAIAETSKLAITVALHVADPHRENGSSAWAAAVGQLSLSACLHIFSLASLYTLNNQLAFYVAIQMDPGTIFLFKAANALIVAAIQMLCVGRRFSGEQIRAMVQQRRRWASAPVAAPPPSSVVECTTGAADDWHHHRAARPLPRPWPLPTARVRADGLQRGHHRSLHSPERVHRQALQDRTQRAERSSVRERSCAQREMAETQPRYGRDTAGRDEER